MTEPRSYIGVANEDGSPTQWIPLTKQHVEMATDGEREFAIAPKILEPVLLEYFQRYQPLSSWITPLRWEPESANARATRERQRRDAETQLKRELADAEREWSSVNLAACCDGSDSGLGMVVLAIHQPTAEHDSIVCAECQEQDGYDGTRQVEWPCRTYTAIREAA